MIKWLLAPLLWVLAACIALAVLWRLWRGHPVVLRGRLRPRLLRMVVILLVTLGIGVEDTPGAPPGQPDDGRRAGRDSAEPLPSSLTTQTIRHWLYYQAPPPADDPLAARLPGAAWQTFKKTITQLELTGKLPGDLTLEETFALHGLPRQVHAFLRADAEALVHGRQPPAASAPQLLDVLQAVEQSGHYDPWLVAHIWRKTRGMEPADADRVVQVFQRLHQLARLNNTLVRARARVQPVMLSPRAWMSKAGPRPAERLAVEASLAEMLAAVKALYPSSDVGTWQQDGVVLLEVDRESARPTLHRGVGKQALEPGAAIRLGRLDVLGSGGGDAPIRLRHAWLGTVQLSAGGASTVWDLARGLQDEGRIRAQQVVRRAVAGDEAAAEKLEQAMPLVHSLVREELSRQPHAPGAPRLRLILALFDDAAPSVPPPGR